MSCRLNNVHCQVCHAKRFNSQLTNRSNGGFKVIFIYLFIYLFHSLNVIIPLANCNNVCAVFTSWCYTQGAFTLILDKCACITFKYIYSGKVELVVNVNKVLTTSVSHSLLMSEIRCRCPFQLIPRL